MAASKEERSILEQRQSMRWIYPNQINQFRHRDECVLKERMAGVVVESTHVSDLGSRHRLRLCARWVDHPVRVHVMNLLWPI